MHHSKDTEAEAGPAAAMGSDETEILNLGYGLAYRRVFGTIESVGAVISVASPIGVFIASYYQMIYGGYWGMSWGWIIPAVICFAQPLAVAELCSSMPVNGAFYWWTAALAPRHIARPLSFVAGWTNCMSLLTSLASFAYAAASSYGYIISMLHPEWIPTNVQIMGIAMGMVLCWGLVATLRMERFQWIFLITASIMSIANVVYVIALPVTHSQQGRQFATAAQVFGDYTNFSLWDNGIAVPMSMFTAIWVITGWQAPAFIAEETHNASRAAPRAIIVAYSTIALGGLIVSLVTAFCIPDMSVAALDPSSFAMFTMVVDHWGTQIGCAFLMILMTTTCMGGSSLLLTSSSQVAAFARDGGLPFARVFSYVHEPTNMPIASAGLLVSGALLVLLFALSNMARTIIFSLAVIANILTYALPISLRILYKRNFVPGPFNYGKFSLPIHVWAIITMAYFVIMECFPASPDWDISTFNYNWVVTVGIMGLSGVIWFFVRDGYKMFDIQAINGELHDVSAVEEDPAISYKVATNTSGSK